MSEPNMDPACCLASNPVTKSQQACCKTVALHHMVPSPMYCFNSPCCPLHLQFALLGYQVRAATCRICHEGASTPSGGMLARPQGVPHRGTV